MIELRRVSEAFLNFTETGVHRSLGQDLTRISNQYDTWQLATHLTPKRVAEYSVAGAGYTYNYAAKWVNRTVIGHLGLLAGEIGVRRQLGFLAMGDYMNMGEGRMVLHHAQRGRLLVPSDPSDARTPRLMQQYEFYEAQQAAVASFADQVRKGELSNQFGQAFRRVVQIGIGGSDLGPRAMHIALRRVARERRELVLPATFVSNVDPDDINETLANLVDDGILAQTLFIFVSKSGDTQETVRNLDFVRRRLVTCGLNPAAQMLAVTGKGSPADSPKDFRASFYIDEHIGGRYSVTSPVGTLVLSLSLGTSITQEFLAGAHEADKTALSEDIRTNPALMDAMIGVWERNFLGFGQTAILPYSQALERFVAHLQQVDMESNGKSVDRQGRMFSYYTGPAVWGEPGTNGQHSFYQLLHQGANIIPLQFIAFGDPQLSEGLDWGSAPSSQRLLNANVVAQMVAFARGQADENLNKAFPGGRPSSFIFAPRLTPAVLGALLAHYENKIMFQGFAWNLNSFDQEGVQLGKQLAKLVSAGAPRDPVLQAYMRQVGLLD